MLGYLGIFAQIPAWVCWEKCSSIFLLPSSSNKAGWAFTVNRSGIILLYTYYYVGYILLSTEPQHLSALSEASFRGGWGAVAPKEKEKRKKERKKEKREKKRKKREKERSLGTMNDVKLLHVKCCFFQFFNSPVALKIQKKFWPPPRKSWNDAPVPYYCILNPLVAHVYYSFHLQYCPARTLLLYSQCVRSVCTPI